MIKTLFPLSNKLFTLTVGRHNACTKILFFNLRVRHHRAQTSN